MAISRSIGSRNGMREHYSCHLSIGAASYAMADEYKKFSPAAPPFQIQK